MLAIIILVSLIHLEIIVSKKVRLRANYFSFHEYKPISHHISFNLT